MQEGSSNPRQSTFKEGLGTVAKATERRIDENLSLRKVKRKEKLRDRRIIKVEPWAGGQGDVSLEQIIVHKYSRSLLEQKNLGQLKLLCHILHKINPDELEKYYTHLFAMDGKIIRLLIDALSVPVLCIEAAACIANTAGNLTNEDYRLNFMKHLAEANIFNVIWSILKTNPPAVFAGTLWTIVCNFTNSCAEGPHMVLASCLFAGGSNSPFMEEMKMGRREVAYPLVDIIRYLLESHAVNNNYSVVLPPEFFRSAYFILCTYAREPLEQALGMYDRLDEDEKELVPSALRSIWLIYTISNKEQAAWYVQQHDPTWMMLRAFNKFVFTISDTRTQHLILSLFNKICSLSVPNHFLPRNLLESQCLQMFVRAAQSPEKQLRRQALFCIGSFMWESTDFVCIAMNPPYSVMDAVLPALKDRNYEIKIGALYCIMTMFQVAEREREVRMNPQCTNVLRRLIVEFRLFNLIVPYLHLEQEIQVCMDVLQVFVDALTWNKPLVMQALEMAGGDSIVEKLLSRVHTLKGNHYTPLYNLASKVDDIISGTESAEFMELEQSGGGGGREFDF